jgi:hypothetical protein
MYTFIYVIHEYIHLYMYVYAYIYTYICTNTYLQGVKFRRAVHQEAEDFLKQAIKVFADTGSLKKAIKFLVTKNFMADNPQEIASFLRYIYMNITYIYIHVCLYIYIYIHMYMYKYK